MMPSLKTGKFVIATPFRTVCDDNARALERHGLLRFIALGTRRGTAGIPSERTRLKPMIGLVSYLAAKTLSPFHAESVRFRLHPWLDAWVKKQLTPGDHILSSYGYANESFRWIRKHGGKTFLDGGNSHPENFWNILVEEHRRWRCDLPPIAEHQHWRGLAMMEHVDYVLSPSTFVSRSFLERGFAPGQILSNTYPLDLSCFTPATQPRPADRPLTLISTGSLSLRKGTPYLLEAFRLIRKEVPNARLLLTDAIADSAKPILAKYSDLPIDWAPGLPHPQLAERLRSADIFLLPSLEEGLARSLTEALACGLPIITTPNSGVNDYVIPDYNGSVVPIRDPYAIAIATLEWSKKVMDSGWHPRSLIDTTVFSFEYFQAKFIEQLKTIGISPEC